MLVSTSFTAPAALSPNGFWHDSPNLRFGGIGTESNHIRHREHVEETPMVRGGNCRLNRPPPPAMVSEAKVKMPAIRSALTCSMIAWRGAGLRPTSG